MRALAKQHRSGRFVLRFFTCFAFWKSTMTDHVKITLAVGDLPRGEAEWMARNGFSPCCHAHLIPGPKGGLSTNCWCGGEKAATCSP